MPELSGVPAAGAPLRLRGHRLDPSAAVVMAVINRTPDSFYAGARFSDSAADGAVAAAVAAGAQIIDVGGVRAGRGPVVDVDEEIARVIPLITRVRARHPEVYLSVDTWRAEVAVAAADAGVDLLNDTWAGHDPHLVEVAAERGLAVVCSHTGGALPRTDPLRVTYPDGGTTDGVLADVLATVSAAASRAVSLGVHPESVIVDPTHDFGKNTWHSLELVRRTSALVALGHPVLMAMSRKDFVGETLGLEVDDRLEGTLAATAVAAWQGARVFRTHDAMATRRVLDMVAAIRGELAPLRAVRGLV